MKKGEKNIQGWTHSGEHGKGWEKDRDWSNKGDYEKKNVRLVCVPLRSIKSE